MIGEKRVRLAGLQVKQQDRMGKQENLQDALKSISTLEAELQVRSPGYCYATKLTVTTVLGLRGRIVPPNSTSNRAGEETES